jgi:hypothetical protein
LNLLSRPGALGGQPRARWTAPNLLRVRTTSVRLCWNGNENVVNDEARVRDDEPAVLSAREVIALLGREPQKTESPDDESEEPPTDVVGDPERRT